jgi:hypothetical protein
MGPGGFRRLQNDCDLTTSGLVGSIPMHSRHHRPERVRRLPISGRTRSVRRSRNAAALIAIVAVSLAVSRPLVAQRADSARAGVVRNVADSNRARIPKPPLSPRRAFLYSLALPGYSQSVLGRPTAGALFVLTESIALVMLRESAADLRQARRFRTDSLVVIGYEVDPTGTAAPTPITQSSAYTDRLIDVRRGHVEDWIAFIVANHLFAAADAYVAAHLWDLPTQISVESRRDGAVLAAKVSW